MTVFAGLRKNADLRRVAKNYRVPIQTIKANTIAQITQALQQLLGINEIGSALAQQGQLGQVKEASA